MNGLTADQGYLVLENLLPVEDLQPLIREFEHVVDAASLRAHGEGRLEELFEDEPFDRRLVSLTVALGTDEIYQLLEGKGHKTAGLFAVMTHPAILDVVESVIGPEILSHPQFNARARLPDRDEMVVPWHQDLGLLDADAEDTFMVNFWTPLVDVGSENGCLQVVPGSHKRGLMRHEIIDSPCLICDLVVPDDQCVTCPLRAGSVLLFAHKTIHRSLPNRSKLVRWSLDLRYCDHRLPTGRDEVPGFIARSRAEPQRVARSHLDWLTLMETSA